MYKHAWGEETLEMPTDRLGPGPGPGRARPGYAFNFVLNTFKCMQLHFKMYFNACKCI